MVRQTPCQKLQVAAVPQAESALSPDSGESRMKIQKGELEVQSVLYSPQELAPCSKLREGWTVLWTDLTERSPSTEQSGVKRPGH